MDLSQVPRGPIGSIDDPLADPYEDPSYNFEIKTPDYQKKESADSSGRVRGLYSYLDDIGERHTVRYAAGSETGYEVLNTVPDSVANVRYNAPLYKGSRQARGHSAVERGPNGQYKFISSSSDQRRSETSGPDGIVRGSYSYLDDKGMQRTVQYIAGAGIGYRIVKNTVGPLTHTLPRPAIPDFGLDWTDTSNDLPESVPSSKPSYPGTKKDSYDYDDNTNGNSRSGSSFGGSGNDNNDGGDEDTTKPSSSSDHSNPENNKKNDKPPVKGNRDPEHRFDQGRGSSRDKPHTRYPTHNRGNTFFVPSKRNSNEDFGNKIPDVTYDRKKLNDARNSDWNKEAQDSTLLTNVGDYYVGLPPGAIVRAHVQNIDLLPLGNRAPSPSDALRKDSEDD